MHTNIFNSIVLAATCSLFVACGSNSQTTSPKSASTAEASQNAIAWRAIYFGWNEEGEGAENACAQGRVTLKIDGTLQVQDCGEVREAKVSVSDFEQFQAEIQPVLLSVNRPITCNGVSIADYAQNWKLIDQSGRAIQVFRYNVEDTCGRVKDVDQLNDYLYVLREKYFPRIEEGQYEN